MSYPTGKRQFKSQASSSRAASGASFRGFGSASTGSTLSYLTEPPDLSTISDANVVVGFKNLSKKDATTKSKALEDLRTYIQAHSFEESGGPEEAILEAWVKFYPRLSIDNSRRVRELSHNLQYELLKAARKRMEKHIPKIVGSWLAGTYDRDRTVSRAATDGINAFLDNEDKVVIFWKRCQAQILDYSQEAINETPNTLSDERTLSTDEIQDKYFRTAGSSISLIVNLLAKLSPDDIRKHQDKYEEFLSANKKLWALASCEDSFVRRTTDRLLIVCLDKQRDIIERDLEIVSHAFIDGALRTSQASSAFQLIEALNELTSNFPWAWTSAYKGKKSPLSRLRHFLEDGSQGAPPGFWQSVQSLLSLLPVGVLPTDLDASLEFMKSFRHRLANREERNNSTEGWSSYFDVAEILVEKLPSSATYGPFLEKSIYPVFEQHLHPAAENIRWSIGNRPALLAKAYSVCSSRDDPNLQLAFGNEWTRLADEFISRILQSLPEQSKAYHQSQSAVVAESHRWFELLSKTIQADASNDGGEAIARASSKIFKAALAATVQRNGKPYCAAATVESALRLSPRFILSNPGIVEEIKNFLGSYLSKLILSPSAPYLVSILNLLRSIPDEQKAVVHVYSVPDLLKFLDGVWQSTVDGLLPLPDDSDKLKAITSLISNDTVAELSQKDLALQQYLLEISAKTVLGESEAWPLFEAIITFNILSESVEGKLVDQIVQHLDVTDTNVDATFEALESISNKRPELLQRQSNIHVTLITKLLAITELSDSPFATRANSLRALLQKSNSPDENKRGESPILHVIRENLEVASPQSLNIDTLVKQAKSALDVATTSSQVAALFPNPAQWSAALLPLLEQPPSPALAVMRPFAGAVFAANKPPTAYASRKASRDINGYSVPLRMAIYTSNLVSHPEFGSLLPSKSQVELLYLLLLTAELASDQIDLAEDNKLFGSHLGPEALAGVQDFLMNWHSDLTPILRNFDLEGGASRTPQTVPVVDKLLTVASAATPTALYAAKALSHCLSRLVVDAHRWDNEQWLTDLEILKPSTANGLGAVALLVGLQDILSTSKVVNNLCNRLISDIAGASAQADKTLGLLILLNSTLAVYDEIDLPVAQNRIVFAVKQILSWTSNLATTDSQLTSEACRALQTLLPAMKEVYGSYWETTLNFCISIWNSTIGDLTPQSLPMIGMSLKLFTILRNLTETNDDLEDALTVLNESVSQGLINLLKLERSKDNKPLEYVDELLWRNIRKIPIEYIKDLSDFYPLIASDFRRVQSAAFDVLHEAIPEAQRQISVDVLLEKTDAQLPEELLSLLLDPPCISNYSDETLAEFPTSIRGYLLSWLLIYDAYSTASYKVRNDYNAILKSENYISPLLDFMADVLRHSAANPLNLEKAHFDTQMIRSYDILSADDSEENERNLQWLLVNLYYQCLTYTPTLVKTWWVDCKSKQTRNAVESWTERFFSPLVISDTLDDVAKWAEGQESPSEDEKDLVVKVSKRSREVFAGYEVDDMMMQIVIRLPATYPLEGVKVDGLNRVAVSEKKWTSWLMITQGVITFANGNIPDGLATFRRNVTGALKGQTECAICYSIISSDRKMPDKRCQTCKNLFHASCLFKWFASSNQSTCPLCRNPFNYGVSRSGGRA